MADATAIALMAEDRILRRAILTFANSEQPVLVQHAVLGLLRNLAIPASNKELMLELGIVEQLSKMRPWQEKMDIAKAVQANGVGVVKNLCRGCGEWLFSTEHSAEKSSMHIFLSQSTCVRGAPASSEEDRRRLLTL